MSVMHRLRAYHAALALLAIAAYISGEWGIIHAWLGYGVALVIVIRLAIALSGARQLGLAKFHPQFATLKLGNATTHPAISRTLLLAIAISIVGVTATGIMMDKGHAIGVAEAQLTTAAWADDDHDRDHDRDYGYEDDEEDEALEEIHEFFANLMLLAVFLHVAYLLAFKRPLAMFMLYQDQKKHPSP